MNISDIIVELLQKGQSVELPGIGTMESVQKAPYHDPKTSTYYPASHTIAFTNEQTGDMSVVKTIAEKECVSEDVAKQMWRNYIDALSDRIKSNGSHTFMGLGTIMSTDKKTFSFRVAEDLVLDADSDEVPLTDVKIYDHDGEEDPFAQFDEEVPVIEDKPEPEPEPEPIPEPEPEPEPEPMPEPEPVADEHWSGELEKVEEISKEKDNFVDPKAAAKAEKARLKAEKKAEEERIRLEKKAEEERIRAEKAAEKERLAREKQAAEEMRKAEEQMRKAEKKAEEERIRAEKEAEAARIKAEKKAEEERIKAERKAEEERIKAEKKAEEDRIKAEKKAEEERIKADKKAAALAAVAARQQAKAELKAQEEASKAEAAAQRAQEKAQRKAEKEAAKQAERNRKLADELLAPAPSTYTVESYGDEDEGKKRRLWPILLLILLLLVLLAGGAYYWLFLRGESKPARPAVEQPVVGKHLDVPAVNSLTFNTDMIAYSTRDMNANTDRVFRNLADYINTFLAERGYNAARAPMMDRVRQYSNQRMAELLGDRFAVQRLIPYDDYIYRFNEPCLKDKRANSARIEVQTELMDYSVLDGILNDLVDELDLKKGVVTEKKTAAEVKQVKAEEKQKVAEKKKAAAANETPVFVYVSKDSKQGFDIIAGFYLNRSTAANLTARLHEQGCDAYIIEKNDLYYVSMGSASTRTAAEALFKHIKSWYDGDVVIKEW